MIAKNKIVFLILLFVSFLGFAQQNKLALAYEQYTTGKLDSALVSIQEVVVHPETSSDIQAWLIKSYVLKDLFKANENTSKAENYRAESVQSFLKARELDKDKKEWSQINQNLKYLGSKYFNEARANIDTLNHLKAVQLFDEYERVYLFADTAFSSKTKELEFYLALASVFQQCFDNNSSKNCLDYAKVYLQKAMDIDPSSTSAIKNMGILYYNQGVNLIKRMEYDISLEELSNFQDQSIKLFHQAEPFLLKAFDISPTDKTVLEGLQGIYFQLSDFDKSNDFKSKLEALNK